MIWLTLLHIDGQVLKVQKWCQLVLQLNQLVTLFVDIIVTYAIYLLQSDSKRYFVWGSSTWCSRTQLGQLDLLVKRKSTSSDWALRRVLSMQQTH